ncbi:MAG: DNA mismatch repair protein MutL [Marteilia pararefringens]
MAEKTSSSKASSSGSGIINQLDEATINLIAAGEILQRPLNAVKELVENSLDSRANRIDVSLRRSGLKTLQVADNGCGIVKQDLALLCRRFCTSKLSASAVASASEQHQSLLSNLQSFGFRGEALASLSHSSRVEVRSKSLGGAAADEPSSQSSQACAFEAHYSDGRLIGEVKACAGNNGTIITAYDLFFNNKCRLAAFRERDEMTLCIDYLMKIALHYPSIAFSLKDLDRDTIVFKTSGESDPRAIISNLFNSNLRDELVSVMFDSDDPEFTCQGIFFLNSQYPKSISKNVIFNKIILFVS